MSSDLFSFGFSTDPTLKKNKNYGYYLAQNYKMIVGISKTKPPTVKSSKLNIFFSLQDEEWKK